MGRTRSRGDDEPCTNDEHDSNYGAIARGLRLLEPRQKCPNSLQGLAFRIFSFSLCERYSELSPDFIITAI
jgi:hypothetical protein